MNPQVNEHVPNIFLRYIAAFQAAGVHPNKYPRLAPWAE
jgi:hypothetical protein